VADELAAIGYAPTIDTERQTARMPSPRRSLYLKIGVAGFAFGNIMLFSVPRYVNGAPLDAGFQRLFDTLNIIFALPVLCYSASDYFRGAWAALTRRAITLDVPIAIGLVALFARSLIDIVPGLGEGFLDSFTGLVFFLLIGKLFQQTAFDRIAFDRTYRSFFPLAVRVESPTGETHSVPLEQVVPGDRVIVRPHEVVPADGRLIDDCADVDYAFLSGEERPVTVVRGDSVRAGGRAVSRALRITVDQPASHSRLAGLWNNPVFATRRRDWLTDVSARFGLWFTVAALALAVAGAIAWWPDARLSLSVATAVLIIACPCALTLSAPITLGTAMSALGRRGMFLKNPGVALGLSRIDTVIFDKTGTLTAAGLVARVPPAGLTEQDWQRVRRLAAESVHPVSRALAGAEPVVGQVAESEEIAGQGIRGSVDGHTVVIGSAAFAAMETRSPVAAAETRVAVAIDGQIRAWIACEAPPRPGVAAAARALAARHQLFLLSGDAADEATRWRPIFGDRMRFRQSPDDKLAAVLAERHAGRRTLMVGDGLNDAGALAAADVGLAVSDETACIVPSCDAVIAGARLADLPRYLAYARRARHVVLLCFVVSIAYNAIGLSLALLGWLTPLVTAVLMPVSSLTIVGISTGAMRWSARELLPQ
jgi:Cu+-exporting ATPase